MAINRIKTGGITDGTIQSGDLAPGTIASDRIAPGTIANDRLANTSITINGTSIALGASGEIVAGTDWQAVTVADGSTQITAEAGKGYFLDTNAGVIEVKLPSSPTRGDTIILMDYSGTFATNPVYIDTQTVNLDSTTTGQYKLSTNDTIAEFVYVDSAKGWVTRINTTTGTTSSAFNDFGSYDGLSPFIIATGGTITTSGDYKIHTFTGDGCFAVQAAGLGTSANPSIVDYMVVAGGGAGGNTQAGGGGAGGFRESKAATSPTHTASPHTASPLAATTGITVTATTYPITIGAGGSTTPNPSSPGGTSGSNSIFSTITSTGGGLGGNSGGPEPFGTALAGGSGGGGGEARCGNAGNTPPTSPPQGSPGGDSNGTAGAAGGGATAVGGNTGNAAGGTGGAGATTSISGSPTAYAGGGGGGSGNYPGSPGPGGTGGGGPGGAGDPVAGNPTSAGTAGTENTGGGGGGAGFNTVGRSGGAGGKGIVIIRYKFQ